MQVASWSILFAVVSGFVSSAWAQDADEVRKGHDLAAIVCSNCHVAAADQRYTPILNPPAAPFVSIAERKDTTAKSLETFISTTHRGLDNPSGMPNPYLSAEQTQQVVAYILSLRK